VDETTSEEEEEEAVESLPSTKTVSGQLLNFVTTISMPISLMRNVQSACNRKDGIYNVHCINQRLVAAVRKNGM
jgi:hypothetical protein